MGHWHGAFRAGIRADVEQRNIDWRTVLRFGSYLRPYLAALVGAVVLMGMVSGATLVGPYLLHLAIDVHIPAGDMGGLNLLFLAYVATLLTIWFASYGQTYLTSWVGQGVIYELRRKLFAHVESLGLDFFGGWETGRIMTRITNDIDALNQLISTGIVSVLGDIVTLVGVVAAMCYLNVELALVSFSTIPLILVASLFFGNRMRRAYQKVRRRIADVNANLQETISGVRVVQSFARERQNMQVFSKTNQGNMQANLEAAAVNSAFFPTVEVIGAVGTAIILWYGGMQYFRGEVQLGVVVAFLQYIGRFFMPIRNLSQVFNVFQAALVSADRIFEFLDLEPLIQDAPDAVELQEVKGHIRLEHVSFSYTEGVPVLHDIDLEVQPGQRAAFVGPTGAGKTTIINLVSRFWDPQEGRVLVDGIDVRKVSQESLRSHISVVPQDPHLFSGSIRDNLRYGRLDATDEEVEWAARVVGAHDFIERLPEGYDTDVQERGQILSTGQKQLIAFARALIADPHILILDEATSSVDSHTERLLQHALDELSQGRTVLVIAHRLATVQSADVIHVIEQGRIVESGSHDELLARGGTYAALYRSQWESLEVG